MIEAHLGLDDIDTPFGGCTTHFTALLLEKWVRKRRIRLIDYPNLIRLSPGVPWKTRGNGALVLRFMVEDEEEARDYFEEAVNDAYEYIGKYHHPESQPGLALYIGRVEGILEWLGQKAVNDIVPLSLLDRVVGKLTGRVYTENLTRGRRGLIGSLAGIGYRMTNTDYTFELIAYRSEEYIGKPRMIDPSSVKLMDEKTYPRTFLNYDYEAGKPLIAPHGPDPVLLGIRGEEPRDVIEAYGYLKINEPVPLRVLYRTNQHTDAHLVETDIAHAYIYRGVIVRGWITRRPRWIRGGHVVFTIRDNTGSIDAAAYEPSGRLRKIISKLMPGDEVEAYGIVRPQSSRHGPTINVEKIRIAAVKPLILVENPMCPRCGARMESMGKGKGFRCPKCGYRDPDAHKITRFVERDLKPGLYEPPPRSFKHLMKPVIRIGREKNYFPEIFEPKIFIWSDDKALA